jgi:hypothetical protein
MKQFLAIALCLCIVNLPAWSNPVSGDVTDCGDKTIEVRRGLFTSDVVNREPADELVTIYRAPQRLYFYTDIVRGKGSKIRHQWYFNGALSHEVSLNIGSQRWRTWSYLSGVNLSPGDWRVKVSTADGCILADKAMTFSQGGGVSHHIHTPVAKVKKRPNAGDSFVISSLFTDDISWTGADHCLGENIQNDLEQLFFFTEVFGKKGATITHQWQHDLKVVKSEKFLLDSSRQRFTSTLGAEDFSRGMWQINVLDQKGELLGTHRFDIENKNEPTGIVELDRCGLHVMGFKKVLPLSDVNQIIRMEQFGATLNPDSVKDFEVIEEAIGLGDTGILEYFKTKGYFKFDQANTLGQTALMIAAEKGINAVVTWLVEQGVDINQQSKFSKMTALYYAVSNNREDTVELLLNNGADPNIATSYQHTALMKAADDCNANLYKRLLEAGGDKFHTNLSGKSALKIANECEEPLLGADEDSGG